MIKQAPSRGRILVIAAFALSCFGLGLYLWQAFGGALPLEPKGYRFTVALPGASQITAQSDVRMAGINVGKVVATARTGDRLKATVEMQARYAPVPVDTRAIVRTKTVLGESFVALTPGSARAPRLRDGGTLAAGQAASRVTIDEFLGIFDARTRRAFRRLTEQLARQVPPGVDGDLNAALGELPGFVDSGDRLLADLDSRGRALQQLVRNAGVVFGALGERRDQLRQLHVNGARFLSATAREHRALADTISILPTFLDESTRTVDRLEGFARETHPLVRELLPVADQLAPALRELGAASPALRRVFALQRPLLRAAEGGLPAVTRLLDGTVPMLAALRPFLDQLNPAVGFIGFNRDLLAGLLGGASGFGAKTNVLGGRPHHYLRSYGITNDKTVALTPGDRQSPDWRTNAYVAPNAYQRFQRAGVLESWDCGPAGGVQPDPQDGRPPCLEAPPSLWDGRMFPQPLPGLSPIKAPPAGLQGTRAPGAR